MQPASDDDDPHSPGPKFARGLRILAEKRRQWESRAKAKGHNRRDMSDEDVGKLGRTDHDECIPGDEGSGEEEEHLPGLTDIDERSKEAGDSEHELHEGNAEDADMGDGDFRREATVVSAAHPSFTF